MNVKRKIYNLFNLSLLLILIITTTGCDDRSDVANQLFDAPLISLRPQLQTDLDSSVKTITDSVKLSNPSLAYYPFWIDVNGNQTGNGNLQLLTFKNSVGNGFLMFNNDTILSGGAIPLVGNSTLVRYYPNLQGNTKTTFIVTNRIKESDSAFLNLVAFNNLPPVANLKVNFLGQADPYEYELDASGSYDVDANFGGQITQYDFIVNGAAAIQTITPTIKYIFPAPGNYIIQLKVQDNDGAFSQVVQNQITVN
jgi:hypothetical protein